MPLDLQEHEENPLQRINRGIYVPERIPPAAIRACKSPEIAACEQICRGTHGSIPPHYAPEYAGKTRTAERRAGRFAINRIVRPLEENRLLAWARSQNLLLDNHHFQTAWQGNGSLHGSENDVYPEKNQNTWVKRNNLAYHGTWLEFFHRLLLHNWLFPDTELTFRGFTLHEEKLAPIYSQEDISASRGATSQETDRFMANFGFSPIRKTDPTREFDYLHPKLGIEANDLHDENVLLRSDGTIAVMDPIPMMEETSKLARIRARLESPAP